MEKMGQNFLIYLRSGLTGLTPLTVSLIVKYPFFANFLTRDSYVYLDCDNSWNLQHVFQSGACEVSGSPMPASKNQSLMNNHDSVVVSLRIVTIELWTNENNQTS